MKPVKFKYSNTVFGEGQKEYDPLPAYKSEDGIVISKWKLSFKERIKVLFTGNVWLNTLTFNNPPQPLYITAKFPFEKEN